MDLKSNVPRGKKRKTSDDIPMEFVYGKVPPQAKEVEKAVLGAIMLQGDSGFSNAFDIVSEILRAECFYIEAHQIIYQAMVKLSSDHKMIDVISVIEQLKTMEMLDAVGGPYYVNGLTVHVISTASLDQHSRIILEKYMKRRLIQIGGEAVGVGYEDSTDVFDCINQVEKAVFSLSDHFHKKSFSTSAAVITKSLSIIDAQRANTYDFSGVPTGFSSLDKITYGWQPTDLIILAARPSVGKTALALNLVKNAALHPLKPTPVGLFSLEMSETQCMNRILSAESGILFENISRGKMSDFEYEQFIKKGVGVIEQAPIFIDDTPGLNLMEFRSKARQMVRNHSVGLIVIDYLQLMSGEKGGNREQEVGSISRNLKIAAKDLNVPIIALSQLSRQVENRKDNKMPQLSDLRESGSLEMDSDCVMFIYRPEYYDITENENGDSTAGETHIKTAKNRNGKLGITRLRAKFEIQKFEEVEPEFHSSWKPIGLPREVPKSFAEPSKNDSDESPF